MKPWNKIKELWIPFTGCNAVIYASSACYYMVLSIIPSCLLMISLFSLLPVENELNYAIGFLFPWQVRVSVQELFQYIRSHNSIVLLSFSGIFTLWSSSRSVLMLRQGLNAMMDVFPKETFFRKRFHAIALLVVLLCILAVVWISFLFSRYLFLLIVMPIVTVPSTDVSFRIFRLILACFILLSLITVIYQLLPQKRLYFRYSIIGAATVSIIWIPLSQLFSFYIRYLSSYQNQYGPLGVLILGLLWAQISIQIVLYGFRLGYLLQSNLYHPFQLLREIIWRTG